MPFARLMLYSAHLFAVLCAVLLLVPGVILWLFGLPLETGAEVIARRAGVLFFGLACLFYMLRSNDDPLLKRRISAATAAMMAAMAALGLTELLAGRVGFGILPPIAVEAAIAVLFVPHARSRG